MSQGLVNPGQIKQGCVIVAAGRGQRMGNQNKALLHFREEGTMGGQSFLSRIVATCKEVGIGEIVVVVAEPHQEETIEEAKKLGATWVCNPCPEKGMSSSVALGFEYAVSHFKSELCWLWPVDIPGPSKDVLLELLSQRGAFGVVIPSFEAKGGHPVLVAKEIWPELANCTDEVAGARSVFRRKPERVCRVSVLEEKVRIDYDTPDDLGRLA